LSGLSLCVIATIASIATRPTTLPSANSLEVNSLDEKPTWIDSASLIPLASPLVPRKAFDEPVWLCSGTTLPHLAEKSGEILVANFSTESEPPIFNVSAELSA
jgi:hypothetical protein